MVLFDGDQADHGKKAEFNEWKEDWDYAWTNFGVTSKPPTIFVVMGNHDLNQKEQEPWTSFKDAYPDFQYTPGTYKKGKPSGSTKEYTTTIRLSEKDASDLSYSFSYDNVEFVGLDEYQSGSQSKPALSPDDFEGLKNLNLSPGTASTVVFGHVPDWNPQNPKSGHPTWLPGRDAERFFAYDIDHDKGLYYFAGHDHGYYPGLNIQAKIPRTVTIGTSSIAIDVGAKNSLQEIVSAAGGESSTEAFALVHVNGGKINNVSEVYWSGTSWKSI